MHTYTLLDVPTLDLVLVQPFGQNEMFREICMISSNCGGVVLLLLHWQWWFKIPLSWVNYEEIYIKSQVTTLPKCACAECMYVMWYVCVDCALRSNSSTSTPVPGLALPLPPTFAFTRSGTKQKFWTLDVESLKYIVLTCLIKQRSYKYSKGCRNADAGMWMQETEEGLLHQTTFKTWDSTCVASSMQAIYLEYSAEMHSELAPQTWGAEINFQLQSPSVTFQRAASGKVARALLPNKHYTCAYHFALCKTLCMPYWCLRVYSSTHIGATQHTCAMCLFRYPVRRLGTEPYETRLFNMWGPHSGNGSYRTWMSTSLDSSCSMFSWGSW